MAVPTPEIIITLPSAVLTDIYEQAPSERTEKYGLNIYGTFRTASCSMRVSFKNFKADDIRALALRNQGYKLGVSVRQLKDGVVVTEVLKMDVLPANSEKAS